MSAPVFAFTTEQHGAGYIYIITRDGVFFSNSVPMRQVSVNPAMFEDISEADAISAATEAITHLNTGVTH